MTTSLRLHNAIVNYLSQLPPRTTQVKLGLSPIRYGPTLPDIRCPCAEVRTSDLGGSKKEKNQMILMTLELERLIEFP